MSSSKPRRPETRSMGLARYRNQLEQKSLGRRLETLNSHFRFRNSKLMTEIGQLEEHIKLMTPVGGKAIICPKGLSEKEKAQYRKLRRSSCTPSMTLQEFDVKFTDFRQDLMTYRRASHSTNQEDMVFEDAGIVDLEEHKFCAPLTKHKHTMKEALKRATATPKATEVSPQFAVFSKPRVHSESSAASVTTDAMFSTPDVVPNKDRNFRRSVSHPEHRTSLHPSRPTSVAPSTSGTSPSSGGILISGVRPASGRVLSSVIRPVSATALNSGTNGSKKTGYRSKSATAGRRDSKRQDIVIMPDFIAARRMSCMN